MYCKRILEIDPIDRKSLTMGVFHIVQIIGKNKNMKLLEQ